MPEDEPVSAVVYGDAETVHEGREEVYALASATGLTVVGWYSDHEGLRDVFSPADAPGLVDALAACVRQQSVLFIPYVVDAPGEQRWRLIAHFLVRRGLGLRLGAGEFAWHEPTDPVDLALRWTLDAADELATAVAVGAGIDAVADFLTAS